MKRTGRFAEIVATVKAAFGSLDEPNYAFAEERLRNLRQHPVIADLMARWFVRDETDLNNHMALHLKVRHAEGCCVVCLSLVDKWAMLFRLAHESQVYEEVIHPAQPVLSSSERDIVELVQKHGFNLLSKAEAALPIPMNLFSTERDDVRIYHAVIADDGVVPEVLLR